ncbi:centrosomal protein of 78 kDa isoform X2 [Trichomycterus rosablanca]|uniref:centrosomal protein of 78 kDa isoform X2 n=1 Tax=Trichomycterus rosablanca TaxID=2290929 RepID=UPI002F35AA4D
MLSSAQKRQQDSQDFKRCYESACAVQGLAPVAAVKSGLNQGELGFNPDGISLPDWAPILSALAVNKQLHHVGIRSCYLASLGSQDPYKSSRKKKTPVIHSKNMTFQLCKAVQKCLCASSRLKSLHLNELPLRERDLDTLTMGLAKSVSLEHLSLAHCPIGDDGLETVCQSVKYSTSIRSVDFTACNLTWRGAEHMANIIKLQAVKRHSTAWAETLRYRKAEFETMGGLRRITLNDNILIADRGVMSLAQELTEDLWVKAVDLQRCGISNEGAQVLEKMLQCNTTLCVLDIRRNPLVGTNIVKAVIKKVLMNTKSQDSQYLWLKPPAKDTHEHSGFMTRRNAGRASFRIGSRKASSAVCGWRPPRAGSAGHIPWRTAARAKLQRGLPPAAKTVDHSFQNASSIRVTLESESESEENENASQSQCAESVSPRENIASVQFRRLQEDYKRLQEELKECRLRLTEERNARLKASSRLLELELENDRLRNINQSLSEAPVSRSVLEDDQVLDSIESSFHKFHAFLDLLKDAGLGQMASMAGIEQEDFGVLGRPQLSSTQQMGQGHQKDEHMMGDTAITENLQRASRLQSSRSNSAASADFKNSHQLQFPSSVLHSPANHSNHSPAPLDQPMSPELQRNVYPNHTDRDPGSDKDRNSQASKSGSSGSSVRVSIHSQLSYSYKDDFEEGRISPSVSSRSSSLSQFGCVRLSGSDGQRSAAGLGGF